MDQNNCLMGIKKFRTNRCKVQRWIVLTNFLRLCRRGTSGAAGLRKPPLKAQSDSDDDFVMEGSEESSSSSEDGNGRSNEASDGASDDSSSQEERKQPPSKSKGAGNAKTKSPLSPSPQSDEVCSVCEVRIIIVGSFHSYSSIYPSWLWSTWQLCFSDSSDF